MVENEINTEISRIGFYIYATNVNKSRDIQYWNKTDLVTYINGLYWTTGWTNSPQMIDDALVQFAASQITSRPQVFVLLTPGNPCTPEDCPFSACNKANQLKSAGNVLYIYITYLYG